MVKRLRKEAASGVVVGGGGCNGDNDNDDMYLRFAVDSFVIELE